MSIATNGRADVVVDAPIEEVWRVVSDVTRTGEWSHECRRVTWLHGAGAPAPGVRFRGSNRSGWLRWTRTCEFTEATPPRRLAWTTVATPLYPDTTEWQITLEPAGNGTRIVETYQVTAMPRWLARLLNRIQPAHRDRNDALAADLHRLGEIAARVTTH